MPIYEYECNSCGFKFELKQSFDSADTIRCPECEGKAKRKFSSSFRFTFAQPNRESKAMPGARQVRR